MRITKGSADGVGFGIWKRIFLLAAHPIETGKILFDQQLQQFLTHYNRAGDCHLTTAGPAQSLFAREQNGDFS